MTSGWQRRRVPLRFALGDKVLFAVSLDLCVREAGLSDGQPTSDPRPPADPLPIDADGWLIRSLPLSADQPPVRIDCGMLCYVAAQYQRYYIDLGQSFDDYARKFSAKTRSTIARKVRRFAEHCGGRTIWRVYRTANEMIEFHAHARKVSARSYQERLLDAGLPDDEGFRVQMRALADSDQVRGYVLFDGDRPVSYLYCPASGGALFYSFLGYDPDYRDRSVGTVLQWLALESIFGERCFRVFDFTEGQSDHKRLFATDSVRCANMLFLRDTPVNRLLVRSHTATNRLSSWLGDRLQRLGVKKWIKQRLRFGLGAADKRASG
jgi:hypothetical protein